MIFKYLRYLFASISHFPAILFVYCLLSPNVLANSIEQTSIRQNDSIDLSNEWEKIEHIPSESSTVVTAKIEHQVADSLLKKPENISSQADIQAQEPTPSETPTPTPDDTQTPVQSVNSEQLKDWHFKIQPYGTIPVTTYGNATVKGRTVDYHMDLGDILEVLRATVSGRFEAWHNDLGFIVDAYYVSLNGGGIAASGNGPLNASLNSFLTFDQGIYDFALSYHFGAPAMYSLPEKPSDKTFPLFSFEPIAGVRLNTLSSSITNTLSFGIIKEREVERTRSG